MNRTNLVGYLKTFLLTLLAVIVCVFILLSVIQHDVYKDENAKQVDNETVDAYLVGVLIEKNKYLEVKDPTNYTINLKLGMLYEAKKDYKNSELEYKRAITKAPYDEYKPQYRLALLYIKLNRLNEAEDIVSNLVEQPDKDLIAYKGTVYSKLGDAYYSQSDYEDAGQEYQKALFYFSKIKTAQTKVVKDSLASSYVYLADQKVKEMQIQDAIDSLQTALSVVDAPILKYKLAILFMKDNPNLAYQYFDEVFQKEPSIIDYKTYYEFLSTLAAESDAQGNTAKGDLYRYKIKKLKGYYQSNLLSLDDLAVEAESNSLKLNSWTGKYDISLEFKLKNTSEYNIKSLFLDVIFKDGDKVVNEYFQQIANKDSVLKAFAYSPIISLRTEEKQNTKDTHPKRITAEIYVSKTEASYKILLKRINFVETASDKTKAETPSTINKIKSILLRYFFPHL